MMQPTSHSGSISRSHTSRISTVTNRIIKHPTTGCDEKVKKSKYIITINHHAFLDTVFGKHRFSHHIAATVCSCH